MKTELTRTMLKNAVGSDSYNLGLTGVLLEDNNLIACDGNVLVKYAVDNPDNESGILPIDLFKTRQNDLCTYAIDETQGIRTDLSGNGQQREDKIEADYPDWKAVIPGKVDNEFRVGLNLELLKRLCAAIPKNGDGNKHVFLDFNLDNANAPIKFEKMQSKQGSDTTIKCSGVIAPVRTQKN